MKPSPKEVTQMLRAWSHGHTEVLEDLMPVIYDELRRLARRCLGRRRREHTLQATALVHEAYLRLIDQQQVTWQNRAHFFGIAASAMRQVLVAYAVKQQAAKRGGGAYTLSIEQALKAPQQRPIDLIALDDALNSLTRIDPQQSRIIELRYFGGLTIEETAQVLGLSPATVKREWNLARAWLFCQIDPGGRHDL